MMNEEVRSIMATEVQTVCPTQTIKSVAKLMLREQLQQLPVTDEEGILLGVITSYDLWKNRRKRGKESERMLAGDIMTTRVAKLAPKDKVGTAAELFLDRRFKTLPVVNLEGKLKGVVTAFDIIRYSFNKAYPQPILYQEEATSRRFRA